MHVSWSFLDKRRASIKALEARDGMRFILEHTPEDIQVVRERMSSVSAPCYSGMPKTHDPKSGENRMLAGIDKINLLEERYCQALEYFEWFNPAWERLSEDDRYVLEMFFLSENSDAVKCISEHFKIERSSAYVKRKRALDKLRNPFIWQVLK